MNNIILGTQLAFDELDAGVLDNGSAVFFLPLTKEGGKPCELERAGYLKAYLFHNGPMDHSNASKEHADIEWFHFGVCYYNGAFTRVVKALKNLGGVFSYVAGRRYKRIKFLDVNYLITEE